MIHLLTASKDASVYERYPTKNTGFDEILTISKAYDADNLSDIARTFIAFDVDSLPTYVTASSVTLNLKLTQPESLPIDFSIYAYAVTESWNMGIGTFYGTTDTASINWNNQPSVNFTVSGSKSFTYQTLGDLNMDVKRIYNYWTGSSNYGLRLSYRTSVEDSGDEYGYLRYHSKETNTFRQPYLIIGWDDQYYITGSLPLVSNKEMVVKTKDLKNGYLVGKVNKINLVVRERFPLKTYTSGYAYESSSALPPTSYYSIVDTITKNTIVGFSEYTKINCDGTGSYVKFDTSNYPTNRPLQLRFMVDRDGMYEYYEDDLTFTIKEWQ